MLVFSDTSNKSGIIQHLERTLGFNDGDISGNPTRLAQFTADINQALTDAFTLIFKVGGTWNFDDSNHTSHPIITADLVAGQQDYSFTSDGAGNLILDLFKVQSKSSSGVFHTLTPLDKQKKGLDSDIYSSGATGSPRAYDKTGSSLFLYPTPNENVTDGIQLHINREGSFFDVADTDKKAGIAALFHRYLVLHPADNYAMINSLDNRVSIQAEKMMMEEKMMDWYGRRGRDEKPRLRPSITDTR